ncbi:MAG: hypothetical protein ABSD21_04550 [Rhizomicrobium sp.]|jgi:hypothetical protein
MFRFAALAVCGVLLGACSASVDKDEVTTLASAGKTLADAPGNYTNDQTAIEKDSESAFIRENVFDGFPLDYAVGTGNCHQHAIEVGSAIYAQLQQENAPPDALKDLRSIPRCDLSRISQGKEMAAISVPDDSKTKPKPGAKNDKKNAEIEKRREEKLRKLEADAAAALLKSAQEARKNTAAMQLPAAPQEPIKLEQISSALTAYLAGLQGIVASETVDDVDKQLKATSDAVAALAKAGNAPAPVAPATNLFFALFNIGLDQARYSAVRQAVLAFDGVWPAAAVNIATAMRVRHVYLVVERARLCRELASEASRILNDKSVLASGADRLALYDRLEPDVSAANDKLEDAAKTDPADTVAAFTIALHKLALAVDDPSRQDKAVFDSLKDLADKASALDKALSPQPATASKGK